MILISLGPNEFEIQGGIFRWNTGEKRLLELDISVKCMISCAISCEISP